MTTHDPRQARLDTERLHLHEASQRLLTGAPTRSTGALTVSSLAVEAGLPRHRLYEHHADLVSEFKTAAGGGPLTPNIQALQQQLAAAQDRIRNLEDTNTKLERQITTLAAMITELTHETYADNIITMPVRPSIPAPHRQK